MGVPSRLAGGVSTSDQGFAFANVPFPTQPYWYQYFNDFSTYAAGDWTVTAGSTGTSALTNGTGGKLLMTTAPTDDDAQGNQLKNTSFAFASGQDVAFFINFSLGHPAGATGSDFLAGLSTGFTTITPTNGVYFNKAQNSTTLNLLIKGASTTTIPVGTVAAATAYTVGFFYRGSITNPYLRVFSTIPYAASTVSQPSPYYPGGNYIAAQASNETGAAYSLANLPSGATGMTMGWILQAGGDQAQTLTIDYVYAGQSINRY